MKQKKGLVITMIKKGTKEKKNLKAIEKMEVVKVTYVSPDPDRTRILFNAILDDKILVNSLTYIEIVKDGKEVHFISMPSEKGRDGKYYNRVHCYLTDDVIEDVRKQIETLVEE